MWADMACPLSVEPSILLPFQGVLRHALGPTLQGPKLPIGKEDGKKPRTPNNPLGLRLPCWHALLIISVPHCGAVIHTLPYPARNYADGTPGGIFRGRV